MMGSLAKHLDKDNPKVKPIVGQLISALSTPSQEVSYLPSLDKHLDKRNRWNLKQLEW